MNKILKVIFYLVGVIGLTSSLFAGLVIPKAIPAAGVPAMPGSIYIPTSPTRIVDTRCYGSNPTPYNCQPIAANGTLDVAIPTSVVPSGAVALVANVTVTNTSAGGYLTAYPAGSSQPTASVLNWSAGATVPNLVTVEIGSSNGVDFYNGSTCSTDLIVDVEGYYVAPTSSSGGQGHFYPLTPYRIADTRSATASQYAGLTLGKGGNPETLAVNVLGVGGIPGNGVSAVVVNVTVTNTTATSYLTVYPAGQAKPVASNLNWTSGNTVANRVEVNVGSNGQVEFSNAAGATDVIVDVTGYYSDQSESPTKGSVFNPLNPARVIDTRNATGGATGPVSPNTTNTFTIAGNGGVPTPTSTTPATAIVANLTEAAATGNGGYLTLYSQGVSPTLTSDLNFSSGQVVANMSVSPIVISTGTVSIYNAIGNVQYLLDVYGYFTPAALSANNIEIVGRQNNVKATGTSTDPLDIVVTTPAGTPVSSDTVALSATCGSLSNSSVTTGSSGSATATFTSSTAAGSSCTVTASDASGAQSSFVINQVVPTIDLTLSPDTVAVQASSSNKVTLAIGDSNNIAIGSISATYSTSLSGSSCGSASISGTTVTYTPSNSAGICLLSLNASNVSTSTYSASAVGTQAVIVQTPAAPPASPYTVSDTLDTVSVLADGASSHYGTITVTNANGVPVANDPIVLGETGSACGKLSSTSGNTNSRGEFSVTYTSSSTIGTCTILAGEGDSGGFSSAMIDQVVPTGAVNVFASATSILTGSSDIIFASVENSEGPMIHQVLNVTTSGSACGTVVTPQIITDSGGIAQFSYIGASSSGICTITVSDSTIKSTQSGILSINQVNSAATHFNSVMVTVPPSTALVNGKSATITVTVYSPSGAPVANDPVALSVSGVLGCGSSSSAASNPLTDSSGIATFTYTAGNTKETCAITAVEGNTGGLGANSVIQAGMQNSITILQNGSKLALPIAEIPANSSPARFSIVVTNPVTGAPVAGDSVSLIVISFASNISCGAVTPGSALTDQTGTANVAYGPTGTAETPGLCAFLVNEANTSATAQLLVVQTNPLIAPQSDNVNIYATSVFLPANGQATSTFATAVTTQNGNVVPNDYIAFIGPQLLSSVGVDPNCGKIQNSFAGLGLAVTPTDSSGVASVVYQASTLANVQCPTLVIESGSGRIAFLGVLQLSQPPAISNVRLYSQTNTADSFEVTSVNSPVQQFEVGACGTYSYGLPLPGCSSGSGNPVMGDSFLNSAGTPNISVQGSSSSVCGANSLSAQVYETNFGLNGQAEQGLATFSYLPGAPEGTCLITITDQYGVTQEIGVLQTVQGSSAYTLSSSISGTTLSVTVTNKNGLPVAGDQVLVLENGIGCPTISSQMGTTDSLGRFSATLGGPVPGTCVISVGEGETGANGLA